MKKCILPIVFLGFYSGFSQVSFPVKPYSQVTDLVSYEGVLHHVVLPAPDMEQIKKEDEREVFGKGRYRMGVHQAVSFNLLNAGTWTLLPGGDKIWRLKITSPGALATFLFFDQYYLPEGARLHVYNPDYTEIIGAFTAFNNNEYGNFATANVHGQTCVLEYYEPLNVSGEGVLSINEVGHAYQGIEPLAPNREAQASDPCEVDVKCPEGNNWWLEKAGVVRMQIKIGASSYWCSGSMVNNTSEDCTPYVLSAWHCGEGSSVSDRTLWKFYFNYQKSGCGSGTSSAGQSTTGCTVPANSNDGGGASGSDFMLCELTSTIPTSYAPVLNGWDASGTGSSSGVGIHHPAGDVKKISTYVTSLVTSGWGIPSTHWRVIWSQTVTNWGVTEGGSSGSPVFNANHLIVGTLTGGSSYCSPATAQDDPDYYGKMSYHWQSNSNPSGGHLKQFLDPGNTGLTTLWAKTGCFGTGVEENSLIQFISVYPNPASDFIRIDLPSNNHPQLNFQMFDEMGRLVVSHIMAANESYISIDVRNLSTGVYLLSVNDGSTVFSKKIIITR